MFATDVRQRPLGRGRLRERLDGGRAEVVVAEHRVDRPGGPDLDGVRLPLRHQVLPAARELADGHTRPPVGGNGAGVDHFVPCTLGFLPVICVRRAAYLTRRYNLTKFVVNPYV